MHACMSAKEHAELKCMCMHVRTSPYNSPTFMVSIRILLTTEKEMGCCGGRMEAWSLISFGMME